MYIIFHIFKIIFFFLIFRWLLKNVQSLSAYLNLQENFAEVLKEMTYWNIIIQINSFIL